MTVDGFRQAITKESKTFSEIQDARKIVDGVHNPNVYAKWVREDVVLAKYDKAEQQWKDEYDKLQHIYNILRRKNNDYRLKENSQKKQLQTLQEMLAKRPRHTIDEHLTGGQHHIYGKYVSPTTFELWLQKFEKKFENVLKEVEAK